MPALRSVLNNTLGDGADTLVAAARELPQLVTLCGIQPEQQDINLNGRSLDAGDAKLLAFDLSKNQAIKTLSCTYLYSDEKVEFITALCEGLKGSALTSLECAAAPNLHAGCT